MNEFIACQTATVDSLIYSGVPDLVKIDVEGAEHLVIAGGSLCFAKKRPALIMETSNIDLVHRLVERGYEMFRINADNFLLSLPVPISIWRHCDPRLPHQTFSISNRLVMKRTVPVGPTSGLFSWVPKRLQNRLDDKEIS